MNNILEMIKNEKVEWKKLGDVKEVKTVSAKKKYKKQEYLDKGLYPIIDQGQDFIAGYTNDGNFLFDENSYVVFGDHTEAIKYVDFPFAQGADGIKVIKTCEEYINSKYLYHVLLNFYKITGDYKRHFSILKELEIPIPSLETQERIVKILDAMVGHFTQLEAELEARNKQYEYYRDKLLSEEYLNKLTNELLQLKISENLNFISLEDLVDVVVGGDVPKHSLSKTKNEVFNIPIYSNGTEEKSLYGYTENARVFDNSITVSARGTIGYVSFKKEPYYPIVRLICLIPKKDNFNLKFLYYFLQQYKFNYVETGIPSLTSDMVKKIKVPLPNIEIQNTIVDFLDRFQAIIQDVDGLLPKEIELRKKQYEYYRERLLDFKRDDDE